jgi:hypothetical protein
MSFARRANRHHPAANNFKVGPIYVWWSITRCHYRASRTDIFAIGTHVWKQTGLLLADSGHLEYGGNF